MVRAAALTILAAFVLVPDVPAQEVVDCPAVGTAGRDRIKASGDICADEAKAIADQEKMQRAFYQRGVAFADRPPTAAMQARIRRVMDDVLLDEPSARYRWPLRRHPEVYCFEVNAKNRFGAYTGWEIHAVDTTASGDVGGINETVIFCEDLK